jgi:hypothetical protein
MGFDHPEQHSTQQHSADSFPYTNPKHMVYFTEDESDQQTYSANY